MLKGRLPLIIGISLGILSGLISYLTIRQEREQARKGWDTVKILVADREIKEGSRLEFEDVAEREIPQKFLSRSMLKPADLQKNLLGRTLVTTLLPGDPIQWFHFMDSQGFEKLSNIVQKRGRAIALRVSPESSVANFIRPNDHVDLIGTFRDPESSELMAITMLQNVIVLTTGALTSGSNLQVLTAEERNYPTISLLVLPEEAEVVTLAQELGNIYLTLRHPEDLSEAEERGGKTTMQTLLTGARARTLQQRRFDTIQVIRGGQ